MKSPRLMMALLPFLLAGEGVAAEDSAQEKEKILREKTRLLRKSPKRFATFRGADPSRGEVELLTEGEKDSRVWKLDPEAEIKIEGFWGRLEDLRAGDRVWAWLRLDRKKRPVGIFMIADEISEQAFHKLPYSLEAVDTENGTLTVKRQGDETRTLTVDSSLRVTPEDGAFVFAAAAANDPRQPTARLRPGDAVYLQTTEKSARVVVGTAGLETLRDRQRSALREKWRREGLPGTVTFLHNFAGEIEVMLDHEAMRWGRHLKPNDAVEINIADPIRSVVMEVRPWRERTRLRLAVSGFAQSDVRLGQRLFVRVPEPPPDVSSSKLPPDLGRERSRPERIEWFLASSYCACSIAGDGCTDMVYTLASCNPKTCGMPNRVRKFVGELIDRGLGDAQVFEGLEREHGPLVFEPHLLR